MRVTQSALYAVIHLPGTIVCLVTVGPTHVVRRDVPLLYSIQGTIARIPLVMTCLGVSDKYVQP